MTQKKDDAKKTHGEKVGKMTAKEKILHAVGMGMAAYTNIRRQIDPVLATIGEERVEMTAATVPLPILIALTNVVGELVEVAREHTNIDMDELAAYMARKEAEARQQMEDEEEGICPGCGVAHQPGNPIEQILDMLAAAMQSGEVIERMKKGGSSDDKPPKSQMH